MAATTPFYIRTLRSINRHDYPCTVYSKYTKATRREYKAGLDAVVAKEMVFRIDKFICSRDNSIACPMFYNPTEERIIMNTSHMELRDQNLVPVLGHASPNAYWINNGSNLEFDDVFPGLYWYRRRGEDIFFNKSDAVQPKDVDFVFDVEVEGRAIKAIPLYDPTRKQFV